MRLVLVVAGLRALGIVEGVFVSFALWGILSVALVLPLRPLLKKYFPPQQRYDPSDEDLDAYGQVVEVLPPADEGEVRGRIRFQGTTWPAACTDGSVPAGPKARLLHRDRLCWIVEPLPSLPEARIVPRPPEGND